MMAAPEDEAQHDSSQDSPVEHVLIFGVLNAKRGKNHHHDKKVVHRKGFLDEVARKIGDGHVVAIALHAGLKVVGVER